MKVLKFVLFIFAGFIVDNALTLKGRKCFYPNKKFASSKAPFRISYQYQQPEFDLANESGGKSIFNAGLGTRFRSGVADVEPVRVSCKSQNVTSSMKLLKTQIKCTPRNTVLSLKPPLGFILSPSVVEVKKCAGMCTGAMKCISKTTKEVEFYVRAHNQETNEVICSSILVPEDTSCKCGCQTKVTDCLPSQKYDKSTCSCKCTNSEAYNRCVQRNYMDFKWDEQNCICACNITMECTTGSYWDKNECRCQKYA
ncbi:hypothetical protein WA026_009583 [Henosepilachna vigintioctopunctata]|uniref:Uncharacterized protein n=1 Tax=Henosepilachna vigintioctopunctata TaxID=420089 RepID=A0AAW1U555_9CUCU